MSYGCAPFSPSHLVEEKHMKLLNSIAFLLISGDASNDDHGAVTGITTTAARASLDNAATATDDGVIDVFAHDDFSDVQAALEKVRDGGVE